MSCFPGIPYRGGSASKVPGGAPICPENEYGEETVEDHGIISGYGYQWNRTKRPTSDN